MSGLLIGLVALGVVISGLVEGGSARASAQDAGGGPGPVIEIVGVNPTELPVARVAVNVVDAQGQPVGGLTVENFALGGPLGDVAQIVSVESITDDELPFSVALVVDTSSSMAGTPIDRARAAAQAFVEALRPQDSVALIGFDDEARLLQPFTTDKDALRAAIDAIPFGGETALYEGALLGVEVAEGAPDSRRVVILLSDGAEFGETSNAARPDALEAAQSAGVPVYAVGLGFGTDRTYLEELSAGTNGRFYESPTPEELTTIYADLAALLRTSYIVTLNADVPLDGTEYAFELSATTPGGPTNLASGTLRAPVPVPVVRFGDLPAAALTEPTELRASIIADDNIAEVGATLNGAPVEIVELTRTPQSGTYSVQLDPFNFPPGDLEVVVTATDDDGEAGEARATVSIGAVPARLALETDLAALGAISTPVEVTLSAAGQTPVTGAVILVDGVAVQEIADEAGLEALTFTLDPFTIAPGERALGVEVTSASGATSLIEAPFSVAVLPPLVAFAGIESGALIAEPVSFDINAIGQSPITEIALYGADTVIGEAGGDGDTQASATFTLDPVGYFPGGLTLTAVVTDSAGGATSVDLPVEIAALPPILTVNGVADGDVIAEPRAISVTVGGQTPGVSGVVTVDGEPQPIPLQGPEFSFVLDPLTFAPGVDYALGISITNEGGQTAETILTIAFDPAFYVTLTPPTPTSTITATPSPTLDVEATSAAGTQIAVQTADALATSSAQSTADAEATSAALAAANATTIAAASETAAAIAAANATTIAAATATADAVSAADAANAAATADAQARIQITRDWFATAAAEATNDAQATADIRTADAQATGDAVATQDAVGTATALAAQEARDAAATADASATAALLALTEEAAAQIALTQQQATVDARATREAAATINAQAATLTAQATPTDAPTETATPTPEPTATESISQVQAQATETATDAPTPTATDAPTDVPPTDAPTDAPTETATATDAPTEAPTDAPTQSPTETEAVAPTPTIFDPTATPIDPTEIEAQGAPQADNTPLLLALACGGLLILLLLILFLTRRNRGAQ